MPVDVGALAGSYGHTVTESLRTDVWGLSDRFGGWAEAVGVTFGPA